MWRVRMLGSEGAGSEEAWNEKAGSGNVGSLPQQPDNGCAAC